MKLFTRPEIGDLAVGKLIAIPARDADTDSVLFETLDASWTSGGQQYRLPCPPGWDFRPGVNGMPWLARVFVRFNLLQMLRSSAVHDLIYATKGGGRVIEVTSLAGEKRHYQLPFTCDRAMADAVSREIHLADGMPAWAAAVVWVIARLFGQSAWDD